MNSVRECFDTFLNIQYVKHCPRQFFRVHGILSGTGTTTVHTNTFAL